MSSWVWWVIGTVGLGGALTLGAVLIFGWPAVVGTRLGRALLAIGTAGLGMVAIYLKGRSEGRAAERKRQEAEDADFIEKDRASDAAYDGMSRAELERLLRDGKQPGGQ